MSTTTATSLLPRNATATAYSSVPTKQGTNLTSISIPAGGVMGLISRNNNSNEEGATSASHQAVASPCIDKQVSSQPSEKPEAHDIAAIANEPLQITSTDMLVQPNTNATSTNATSPIPSNNKPMEMSLPIHIPLQSPSLLSIASTSTTSTTTSAEAATQSTKASSSSSSSHLRLNKFVRRLHDMLVSEKDSGIVEWRRGLLVLHSTDAFAKQILPNYFNTRNFKTFRRQLNYYGFVHVRSFSTTGSSTTALWVNQELAHRAEGMGTDPDDVSSVLMLRRVEPCESSKTAEGRRERKEQAIHTVEEDLGVNAKSLQLEQIRAMAVRGQDLMLHHHTNSNATASATTSCTTNTGAISSSTTTMNNNSSMNKSINFSSILSTLQQQPPKEVVQSPRPASELPTTTPFPSLNNTDGISNVVGCRKSSILSTLELQKKQQQPKPQPLPTKRLLPTMTQCKNNSIYPGRVVRRVTNEIETVAAAAAAASAAEESASDAANLLLMLSKS